MGLAERDTGRDRDAKGAAIVLALADLVGRLRADSLEMQAKIGAALEAGDIVTERLFELQGLDRQTQILSDIAALLTVFGNDLRDSVIRPDHLQEVCTLEITRLSLFGGHPAEMRRTQKARGDVQLF